MKPEQLHDALNLLDDELILPVEQLRRRKRIPWQGIAALAACFVLVFSLGLLIPKGPAGQMESARGDSLAQVEEEGELQDREDSLSIRQEGVLHSTVPGTDMADDRGQAVIMETVLVEVVQLGEDHFLANVLTGDRNFPQGTRLKVLLTEHSCFIHGSQVQPIASAEAFFNQGAVLVVDYGFTAEENTIQAETISFGE